MLGVAEDGRHAAASEEAASMRPCGRASAAVPHVLPIGDGLLTGLLRKMMGLSP